MFLFYIIVHLHGHAFQVVAKGDGHYDGNSSIPLNAANPMRRDTIQVPGEGFVILRFRADNPGVWVNNILLPPKKK